jgi:hypothetical protein
LRGARVTNAHRRGNGSSDMQRRIAAFFATTVLIFFVLAACRTRTASQVNDKKAAINVVLAHEQAIHAYDFAKADSLHTPDAGVIEESYPHPLEPDERPSYGQARFSKTYRGLHEWIPGTEIAIVIISSSFEAH